MVLVVTVSTLAGYYLSRFEFPGRAGYLQGLLVLHAFPAMTLIIPIFLMMYWIGLLDTLTGVILVIAALELPFAIFVMKGFFDAVPWDIEMSAMTDGASRRQAFCMVVLPQVQVGHDRDRRLRVPARLGGICLRPHAPVPEDQLDDEPLSVLDARGRDGHRLRHGLGHGRVLRAAERVLYTFTQKYLTQMTIGGIKG